MFKFDVNFEILKISITVDLKKATNCVPVFYIIHVTA